MKIDCNKCNNSCCGKNPHLTPVLLPSEEKKFAKYSKIVRTAYRKMFILKKKNNKNCIFLDNKTLRCTNYENRPLECQLYPFLLNFKKGRPGAELDERFCPHLKTLVANKKEISRLIGKHQFTKDWIDGYKTLDDY